MALRIGINGFGRIGRNVLRAAWHRTDVEFVHINDLTSDESLAYLLAHDSVHRGFGTDIKAVKGGISVDGKLIPTSDERDPSKLPWADRKVDVVFECTGAFSKRDDCAKHLAAGAPKVILSAPGSGVDGTFVYGVNHLDYRPDQRIVSNASCTTNCLAPLAKVLDETVGIVNGMMTTVHSYTMDQSLLDSPHRKDFRRGRAAAQNMVPTSTGAAKAIGDVIPSLTGKLHGMAIRVPTPNVSLVDLVFTAGRDTTAEEINAALTKAAAGPLKGILQATHAPIVSSDLIGNPHSSIADLELTSVIDKRLVKVLSWYDNEWGFSNRMIDFALHMGA